jgi:ATP-dependent Clp protease ATP-binding subunit ClpA
MGSGASRGSRTFVDVRVQPLYANLSDPTFCREIVRAYQTHVAGRSPVGRPIGNFLFLGPTGSGKTRIVEATAESLLKNSLVVIKIDCAEFHSHEITKLIGSPPGYLAHRETHALLSILQNAHGHSSKLPRKEMCH